MHKLGIPTVLDRFIQQALLQVLQPMLDPDFSKHSHGFRPGHRAHDAVVEAQRHVQRSLASSSSRRERVRAMATT